MQTPSLGHDLVDIQRFERAVSKREGAWKSRVFTDQEWETAARRPDRMAVLAARFAAKEAVMKALGTGWGKGVQWTDIEVIRGGRQAPELVLTGEAKRIVDEAGAVLMLSMSHTDALASAVVVAYARA